MAITGTWKARQTTGYAGANVWGTGVNPVHALRTNEGRDIAPDGIFAPVPQTIEDDYADDVYGYADEDSASALWGYGPDTGLSDRPRLDEDNDRSDARNWPPPGRFRSGIPGGSVIRSRDHGAEATVTAKGVQPDAQQGHAAKVNVFGEIDDAVISDPSQYEMQTSMTQMPKDRTGSQRGGGSDSEYTAPVPGRRPTMRQRAYVASGQERHEEMMPQQQELILRPFHYRSAGTGNPEWMEPNAWYQREPLQRVPTPDPYPGVEIPAGDIPGFVDEGWSVV